MPINPVNRSRSISLSVPIGHSAIIPLFQNTGLTVGSNLIQGYKIVSYNLFVKNLKVFAQIRSIEEANLPNFDLTDSQTQKLYKALDSEWQSQRKQLNVYKAAEENLWNLVASVSLLNTNPYPYRIYNLMDLLTDGAADELGSNGKIGISIQDVGYGLLGSGDSITIHGSYTEEIFVEAPPDIISIVVSGGSNEGGTLPAGDSLITNNSLISNSSFIKN